MRAPGDPSADDLAHLYIETRARTESLAAPLSAEDQLLQSMPSASPTKWHRAHTTWFFETFLLQPAGVAPFDPHYGYLFNSYYEALGSRQERSQRGLLSRPRLEDIARYRAATDEHVLQLIRGADESLLRKLEPVIALGVAHEEQHQELILTDILHAFAQNQWKPTYRARVEAKPRSRGPLNYVLQNGGLVEIGAFPQGADGVSNFSFDNERPRHKLWLEPFAIANRLLTIRELKAFVEGRGYETPSLWLSEGWDFIRAHGLRAPMHARFEGTACIVFGLEGEREADDDEPLLHISGYEADALARFFSARLPSEGEWEFAVSLEGKRAAPLLEDLFGEAWQWTRSAYQPYPGYIAAPGALGEYNGKFMINQLVLRGSSAFTPKRHSRASYRNFWPAETRFQRTGVRLARDLERKR